MKVLELSRTEVERQLLRRNALRDALENDRLAAIEIIRERFLEVLHRMTNEQLAERILRDSSADEIRQLHDDWIGDFEESEISDEERLRP